MSDIITKAIKAIREIKDCVLCGNAPALPGLGCCRSCVLSHNDQRFAHIDASYKAPVIGKEAAHV